MFERKEIAKGFVAGMAGGAIIDLIFIQFGGPSALFSLLGITIRQEVFFAHVFLGGILGILFLIFIAKASSTNLWLAGEIWSLICMTAVGGIPALFYYPSFPDFKIIGLALFVWSLYGVILVIARKKFK